MLTENKKNNFKSTLKSVTLNQGESIEMKVRRIVETQEPIKDGAPEIFTERKDGVLPQYDMRTDRWEIAQAAMDTVNKSLIAQRDNKPEPPEQTQKEEPTYVTE